MAPSTFKVFPIPRTLGDWISIHFSHQGYEHRKGHASPFEKNCNNPYKKA